MLVFIRNAALPGLALFLTAGAAIANDEALPAKQVIAAIQAAVAARPGLVKEVEVERERGRLIVEVKIVGADGKSTEVRIDPQSNQVIR